MPETPRAAFLDRDGTIIVDRHHLSDPAGVELLPGAADAVRRLNRAGFRVIIVTNQSGIGRGRFTETDFWAVQARMEELLTEHGARFDAVYFCPHSPDDTPACECRKPGPGLYRRAAEEHGVGLGDAIYVGDRKGDALPGVEFGGSAFLIRCEENPKWHGECPPGVVEVESLAEAVDRVLGDAPAD